MLDRVEHVFSSLPLPFSVTVVIVVVSQDGSGEEWKKNELARFDCHGEWGDRARQTRQEGGGRDNLEI